MPGDVGRFIVGVKIMQEGRKRRGGERGKRRKENMVGLCRECDLKDKNKCSEKAFTTNICFDIIILSGCDFIKNSCEYI